MQLQKQPEVEVSSRLLEAIDSFPLKREVTHCRETFAVSPFDIYAECPRCGTRIKVRSFSAVGEIEDVFDAVLEWLNRPGAEDLARRRQQEIEQEDQAG